ncbi:hypothetical protein GCM10022407_22200 [Hymenobacter antarcticus]|uniref:Uncharacterized protein n=1 Tax=Hymenobacter antarcticus TaxID=486270 RepID=A0ABP7Q4Y5_9BACT
MGAWWLLLLLGRVMAPEAAVLSLHAHQHTVEVAHRPAVRPAHHPEAEVSPQHRHCHTEQLYDAAFQPALPPGVPLPRVRPLYATYQVLMNVCPARHLLPGAALRGPPVA